MTQRLLTPFFARDVLDVARELIGATITYEQTGGVIVETEAYHFTEAACHGHKRITPRSQVLFGPPGHIYTYHSYGQHVLLNFVTEEEGSGSAVLIRALEPQEGIPLMRQRRRAERLESLCSGPGKLTQALGIGMNINEASLDDGSLIVCARREGKWDIIAGPRIGISEARELPWRFCLSSSHFLSARAGA